MSPAASPIGSPAHSTAGFDGLGSRSGLTLSPLWILCGKVMGAMKVVTDDRSGFSPSCSEASDRRLGAVTMANHKARFGERSGSVRRAMDGRGGAILTGRTMPRRKDRGSALGRRGEDA